MSDYTRDEAITDIAKLIAGLQVPASLDSKMMLGEGADPWHRLFAKLHHFGWTDAEQIEKELREVLDPKAERNIVLWVKSVGDYNWTPRGHYSSTQSAKRGQRKWYQRYGGDHHIGLMTYIQHPGEPEPETDTITD